MKNKKQPPVIFVEKDTETEFLTLADIGEDELTDEQREIVAQFDALAEDYYQHTWSEDGQHLLALGPGGRLRLSGHTTMTCTLFALLLH